MSLRIETITRLPLIQSGTACPKEKMSALESRLLEDLHADIPVLKYLRASNVVTQYTVEAGRLWLVVMLEESTQMPISFVDTVRSRSVRICDAFMHELKCVRDQVAQSEGRILFALSGCSSPLDGSVDTPQASSTATLRRRIKRGAKQGFVQVPSLPYSNQLSLYALPSTLPQGPRAVINARVKSLDNVSAQLVNLEIEEDGEGGWAFKTSLSKMIRLERVGRFQRVEAGAMLQRAMDSHAYIRLEVIVALAWDSGDVVHLELAGFPGSTYGHAAANETGN